MYIALRKGAETGLEERKSKNEVIILSFSSVLHVFFPIIPIQTHFKNILLPVP